MENIYYQREGGAKAEEAEEQKERYVLSARQRLQLCLVTTFHLLVCFKNTNQTPFSGVGRNRTPKAKQFV